MATATTTSKAPEPTTAAAAPAAAGQSALRGQLPLIGAIAGSLVLGIGVSTWMTRSPVAPPSAPAASSRTDPEGAENSEDPLSAWAIRWQPGDPVPVGVNPIIARPAGSDVPYMVIVRVAVVGAPDDSKWEDKVNSRLERMRDAVITELMETPFQEMQTRGYKASLAAHLKVRFSKISGLESVREVLISMFAVQ